jgi:predicted nucleic acid-binding protein
VLTAVLDTQIILRGAASPVPSVTAKVYAAWDAGRFTMLLSEPILTEVEDVLGRPEVLRKTSSRKPGTYILHVYG